MNSAVGRTVLILALGVSVAVSGLAQRKLLTEDDIKSAVAAGQKKPSRLTGTVTGIGLTLSSSAGHSFDWIDIYVFTPYEWLKAQSYRSFTKLTPFTPSTDDLAPVLRIAVVSGTHDLRYDCSQVSNVVLRDVKKTKVIQPTSLMPSQEVFQNSFGVAKVCTGATGEFTMDDLEQIRTGDPKREFFITVAVVGGSPTDFKVKERDFPLLD